MKIWYDQGATRDIEDLNYYPIANAIFANLSWQEGTICQALTLQDVWK